MIDFPNAVTTHGQGITLGKNPAKDSPERLQTAAKQFEALLIGQMLKSAKGADGDWLGADGDDADGTATDLGQEYLAQSMASSGGFGLAKSIVANMGKK